MTVQIADEISKHTPGPYKAIATGTAPEKGLIHSYVIQLENSARPRRVAYLGTHPMLPIDELKATAHLLSAAPEMLQVLDAIHKLGVDLPPVIERLKVAAMQKARGEP